MRKREKGCAVMATQLAPTPILTGKSAKKVLKQMQIKPSAKSDNGIKVLSQMFKNKER